MLLLVEICLVYLLVQLVSYAIENGSISSSSSLSPKPPKNDDKLQKIKDKIPNSIKNGDNVDLSKFDTSLKNRVVGGREITDPTNIGILNQIRYRGYYLDTETGYYYLMSRYYNPVVGRFINADCYLMASETVLSTNMYAYCENNPVIYIDSNGVYPKLSEIPPTSSGYKPPKGGPVKQKVPKGSYKGQWGWKDSSGRYWVPDRSDHGGDHWDVVSKDGNSHENIYRDGYKRGDDDNNHGGSGGSSVFSNSSFFDLFVPSDDLLMVIVVILIVILCLPVFMFAFSLIFAFA